MSMYLNFEPHSWYKHFAIKNDDTTEVYKWQAYTDDGNTYRIISFYASTLAELKQKITDYRDKK